MALLGVLECLLLLLALAFSAVSSQDCGSSGGQDGFDYSNGDKGPSNWGNLHPKWSTCNTGSMQSPIDIFDATCQNQSLELMLSYDLAIVNLTKGPKLNWIACGGSLDWTNKGPFKVVEIHWHTPSEHIIDGKRFPLEGHIVHQGPNEELLVRGILYESGTDDPFIKSVMQWKSNPQVVTLPIMMGDFYQYMGSLTTPPCTEGVTWIVHKMMLQVSPSQVQFFLNNTGGPNARPVQPLNDRTLYKH